MKTKVPTALKHHPLLTGGNHWHINGYCIDGQNNKFPVQGYWHITSTIGEAQENVRNIQIRLNQLENDKIVFERQCLVFPESVQLFSNWSEQRTSYGSFDGHINSVEDTLLLQLQSAQQIRSVEAFLKIFDNEYELRGTMLEGDRQLLSWVLGLLKLS